MFESPVHIRRMEVFDVSTVQLEDGEIVGHEDGQAILRSLNLWIIENP